VSNYLTFRILKGAFVVVLISVLTFVIMRMMPGDPVYLLLGEGQIPITDAQIAAICLQHSASLATRNVKDFARFDGLNVIDPWTPVVEPSSSPLA
jgi:ABC-type dipeptide/oligopeptide/nickel transport system permease component